MARTLGQGTCQPRLKFVLPLTRTSPCTAAPTWEGHTAVLKDRLWNLLHLKSLRVQNRKYVFYLETDRFFP